MEIERIAELIEVPLKGWAGNCYSIACKMVATEIVTGTPRYGHWLGPVAPKSMRGLPFVRHGWIEQKNRNIVDPTRWVFEGVAPYIWSGENDGNYDPGGNLWRQGWERPCPEYKADSKQITLEFEDSETYAIVMDMLQQPADITIDHAFWLANLSLVTLGMVLAKDLYLALEKANLHALIPIDNWDIVVTT